MNNKPLVFLALASAAALAACAEPQARPAPDAVPPAVHQPQNTDPSTTPTTTPTAGNPTGPANTAAPAGNPTGTPAGNPADPAAVREKVMVLLSGIEHIPTKEEFNRAGTEDQVVAALDAIARDTSSKLRFRAGAVAALGFYPRAESRKTLETLISDPGLDEVIRRPSIKAYAAAFGPDSVPLLSKQLDHKDRNTREATLRALADVGGPSARKAVEARVKVETDDALKKLAQETLTRWK